MLQPQDKPQVILELAVRNHPGVMSHVCGLFARRAFNVEGILCLPLKDGQQSRIWLLVADDQRLEQRPILLLDEPFSALDPALRNEMLQLLQTVCEQRNLTLLMVSHNLDDAARIAPRTLLVVDGRIYYDGPTQALLDGSAPEARVLGISGKA